jgi:CheY-like chemotaxis protein
MGRLTDALTRTLQILRITHNATNARTATHLLRQLRQPHLTTLDLRHNGLQDAEPLRILARNRDLPRLTLLQLREGNLLSHDDLRALERRMPHVTVI